MVIVGDHQPPLAVPEHVDLDHVDTLLDRGDEAVDRVPEGDRVGTLWPIRR